MNGPGSHVGKLDQVVRVGSVDEACWRGAQGPAGQKPCPVGTGAWAVSALGDYPGIITPGHQDSLRPLMPLSIIHPGGVVKLVDAVH